MMTSNPKYGVGEVHKHSNPMAKRSATVARRVQPARGKGFCEAETSNANNNVKPDEVLEVPLIAPGQTDPGRTNLPVAAVLGVDSMKAVLFTL
jgi:hypothetical protein